MADDRVDDRNVLTESLIVIEEQLRIIVFDRQELFRKAFQNYFPSPWKEVHEHFGIARRQIERDEIDWQYVEGVGLTGSTLAWKRDVLKEAAGHGVIGRFLRLANSFLGSLAGVTCPPSLVQG